MCNKLLFFVFFVMSAFYSASLMASCNIQISEPEVGYGSFTRGDLLEKNGLMKGEFLQVGEDRIQNIMVACDSTGDLSLQFLAPAYDATSYAFGHGGKMIIELSDVYVDKKNVTISDSLSGERKSTSFQFYPGKTLYFWNNGKMAEGYTLTGTLKISSFINQKKSLQRDTYKLSINGQFMLTR